MSGQTRVSDEEMRYFQFKARQLFLLRREDHQWKEFCRRGSCDCCSCQPATKEVAVQAAGKRLPSALQGRNAQSVASVHSLETLNEIKAKLEKIDLALSGRTVATTKEEKTVNQIFPEIRLPKNIGHVESIQNSTNAKRLELIQSSLKQSLQRLQSSAAWKNPLPNPKKKSSSFFLPHELQKQRTIARNAYLASLAKSKTKPQPSSSITKVKNSSKQINTQEKAQRSKVVPKTRNKSNLQLKREQKQEENLGASSQLIDAKDENIESAVDGIVDDLMGETVLLLNKIKQIKSEKSANVKHQSQADEATPSKIIPLEKPVEEQNITFQPSGHWEKIRQNLLNFKRLPEEKSSIQNSKHPFQDNHNTDKQDPNRLQNLSQSTPPLERDAIVDKRLLFVDPQTSLEIARHRREYARYLERISRTKKGNFDPWTLASMISEFLLDECIDEVSKELQDVPGSLITDLYDQEFLQTL